MAIPDNSPLNSRQKAKFELWSHGICDWNGWFCLVKCLQNVEFDDFMISECIYPSFTTGNAVVSLHGLMGAAKLRAGVRVRALS